MRSSGAVERSGEKDGDEIPSSWTDAVFRVVQAGCSRAAREQLEGANARPTPASWAPEADVRAALQLVSVRRM